MKRLISRLLPVIAATMMALTATAGQAATSSLFQDQDVQLTTGAGTSYTGATTTIHSEAGSFLDTFRLTATSSSLIEIALITIGASDDQMISFTNAWLNGTAMSISTFDNGDGSHTSFAYLSQDGLVGDLVLTVEGYAGGSLAAGSGIAASYSGVFNVMPAATSVVPEPQSGSLILAGLGAMGLVAFRRRKA